MEYFSDSLWKIWQARPDDRKFSLVCIVRQSTLAFLPLYRGEKLTFGSLFLSQTTLETLAGPRSTLVTGLARTPFESCPFHLSSFFPSSAPSSCKLTYFLL